jgi:hypothetical protein
MISESQLANTITARFLFTDYPCQCTQDEYNETILKIMNYYGRLDGLFGIFQLGGISAPGLSDLDIVVVFDREIPDGFRNYHYFLNEKQQYIAGHRCPYLLSKSILKCLPVMFYPSTLQPLSGKHQPVDDLSPQQIKISRVCYSIDAAITELLWLLDRLTLGTIPLRPMLCHLYSVRYDIKNYYGIVGEQHKDGLEFTRLIEMLRSEWFLLTGGDANRRVVDLGVKASIILYDIITGLGEYLTKNYCNRNPMLSFYYTDTYAIMHFTGKERGSIKHNNSLPHNRFFNSYLLTLKNEAGIPLLLYSQHNSKAGWRLRHHLTCSKGSSAIIHDCDAQLLSAVSRKMHILDKYWSFLGQITPGVSFFEGPWWNNSRLHKIRSVIWKLIVS